ncbi:MAG: hypothetical protein K8L97_05070 [Anaerolineae bacterium]|nr:hypothetical protein [Anaerolineae bacterium]
MFRAIGFFLFMLFMSVPLVAQDAPDYSIRNIRSRFSDSNRQAVVEFEVWNVGGAADATATVTLNVIATGQQVATDIVQPLKAQEIVTVTLTFPTSLFAPNTFESFRAAIGVGEVEPTGGPDIQDNFAQISLTFPENAAPPEATESPEDAESPSGAPKDILTEFIESLNIRLDFNDPAQVALLAGIIGAVIILLLLIVLIVRTIFQRPPDFGSWQPPYANMPLLDPNTLSGRRQQWQVHAQNGSLPAICTEDAFHVRKLVSGVDGKYFGGWQVIALRLNQYDMYGRISRSQILASKRVVKQIGAVARRSGKLTPDQIKRRLRPAGKRLAGQLRRKLNERNVMLPLAMDVRLRGRHGEVRIWFELYQGQRGAWTLVDQWEPEMAVIGKMIYEGYTYTVYGQRPGETFKGFRQRLQDDITTVLAEMVSPAPAVVNPPPDDQPTNPHMKQVQL